MHCNKILVSLMIFTSCYCANKALYRSGYNRENLTGESLSKRTHIFPEIKELSAGEKFQTSLEDFRFLLDVLRHSSLSNTDLNRQYENNRRIGKTQGIIPYTVGFPCDTTNTRSSQPPVNINRLRPGDIDIIATFGDSILAGNGLVSESLLDLLNEHRGITFAGGGQGTWRQFLTLPNILKVFNPNLYGYATNPGLTIDSVSHLNIAEPFLMSWDLPYQANTLIDRMRKDPSVDMENHWKLLTILTGNNDFCSDGCHHDFDEVLKRRASDLKQTFAILRDNVPRLLINLMSPPNFVRLLGKQRNLPLICELVRTSACHCIFDQRFNSSHLSSIEEKIKRWQLLDERIAYLPEFQMADFAVIYHPMFFETPTFTLSNGDADLRYFAADCFHLSQLGHATVANALWNGMMQPYGKKDQTLFGIFEKFECPTEQHPYLATLGSS